MKDLSVKSQLDLENNKILNGTTDTPTLPESIVNKKYVDNAVDNVHPIFIDRDIFDLALDTDYSITTFINTFYGDTTHTVNDLKTDLDKIFSGCPVTIAEVNNSSTKIDNKLSSPNVYLKVNKDYFLGYRDFKLTWIDPFNKGRLKFLHLTFPQQSSGNINYLVSDEYNLTPDSYESDSDIIPTSTASSKKISDRLNNINLIGDVYKGQTYYDDTNNQLSISTYRRNAVVGIENDKSKPWFKFASFTSDKKAFLDSQISFHVSTGYGDRTKIIGILTAHFRTGTDYKWESGELTWSLCGDTIDPTHFVLAHNDQNPCVVELWCKCVYLYAGYHFDVIAENTRNATVERTWKLTQSWNKDGQTEITNGYTQIVSSYIQLKPNFNDRGFIKLKPNKDTDFSFNSSNLNLNSVEYLKVGTFRADTDAIAQSLTNCPTKCGFVMYVNDPLNLNIDNETTATYVYRLREIRDWQGNIYYQAASSSNTPGTFTYSNWINITAEGSNIDSKVDKSDLGLTTFKVTRGSSISSNGYGYWAAMLNSNQTGSPVLPSNNKWWHVLSMDWSGTSDVSWISQLALPTNDGGVPYYRRNNASGTSINSSTWHKFITDENIADQTVSKATSATSATKATQDSDGNTINTTYLKLAGGTMTGDIGIPYYASKTDGTVPYAGSQPDAQVILNVLPTYKTYLGSIKDKDTSVWYNIVSIRHRNGSGDGTSFGMYLKAPLTTEGNLTWRQQTSKDVWKSEKTLLDSSNYSSYTLPKSGGTLTGHLYLNGIKGSSLESTTSIVFGNSTTKYSCIRANQLGNIVLSNSLTDNTYGVALYTDYKSWAPLSNKTMGLGSKELQWNDIYSTKGHIGELIMYTGSTNATINFTDKTNPRVTFSNSDGTQAVSLVFTDYDSYKAPYGLTLIGNGQSTTNNGAYLKVEGNIQSSTMTATTFTGALSGNATNVTQKKSLTGKSHSNYGTNNGYIPDMSFIAFWNGAYNSSNSSNLTYAHQGTIQCKPTTLYSNASGTTGTITLNQTAANFSYLEIFYCDNNNKQHHSIKITDPNNKMTSLDTGEPYEGDNNLYFRTTSYTISGKSMTVKAYIYMNFWQVSGSDRCGVNPAKSNYIKITKVLGYK